MTPPADHSSTLRPSASRPVVFVEILGFPVSQVDLFASTLASAADSGFIYRVMAAGPEIADAFVANADNVQAMVALQLRSPDKARPAVLVGEDAWDTAWPLVDPRWMWSQLFKVLHQSVLHAFDLRRAAHGRLARTDRWPHAERRRRGRLDLDLTEPDVYAAMRRAVPAQPDQLRSSGRQST
jgi:hypothetical protein